MKIAINSCFFNYRRRFKTFFPLYSWTKSSVGQAIKHLKCYRQTSSKPCQPLCTTSGSIRETLMNWADRAYQTCVRDNALAPEAELERLTNWIFTEGLLDGEITKVLRRQTYVSLAVTAGRALDLRLNIPQQTTTMMMIGGVPQQQWVCGRPDKWKRKPRWRKYP